MDLIKNMMENRKKAGIVEHKGAPASTGTSLGVQKPKSLRQLKMEIIENKPGKKAVKEYFETLVEHLCESSDDDSD